MRTQIGIVLLDAAAPLLDSTLTLAAAAAVTRQIGIGSAVFLPALRPLVWAGRQVATVSHLAAGRLQLGGGRGRWCGSPMPRLGLVTHATIGLGDDRSLQESGVALLRST